MIDIPKNVANAEIKFNPDENGDRIQIRSYNPTYEPNMRQLKKVVEMIRKAQKPVLFGGGGIILSGAAQEFTHLARRAQIPVTLFIFAVELFDDGRAGEGEVEQ